jgi:hypothetical protein
MTTPTKIRPAVIACDVLVVGGGAAGVAAAVAAGRAGAQVVLVERYGYLGGLATAGEVGTLCGLYLRDPNAGKPMPVAGGYPMEFAARLEEVSGSEPLRLDDGLWVLPFKPHAFERVADAMVSGAGNVRLLLHTTVTDAEAENSRVHQVRVLAWNETLTIQPRAVVDCTGEATSIALAGGTVENRIADQMPALVFVMDNVADFGKPQMLDTLRELRRAIEQGNLPAGCDRLSLVPGTGADGRVAFKINLVSATPGSSSAEQVTAWERQGRVLADVIQRFLIERVAAFRHAHFSHVAAQVGVRTGRCIRGQATLSDDDVLGGRKSDIGIVRGCWPVERWLDGLRPTMTFGKERDYYEIPIGCLQPAGLDNVLAAGRCLSATPGALASARVIGTALAAGWAAGTVATFQALNRPLAAAVETIRKAVKAD